MGVTDQDGPDNPVDAPRLYFLVSYSSQRRISSESSIGKQLFKNGLKMLQSRQLADCSDPNVAENRMELARELRDLMRRLDLIRAIGVASRGALQEK